MTVKTDAERIHEAIVELHEAVGKQLDKEILDKMVKKIIGVVPREAAEFIRRTAKDCDDSK